MKLYGFWRSAATHRVRIALKMKGVGFDETMIDLDAGQQRSDAYREVNPQGVVPTLVDGEGRPFFQSMAILEYLDETCPEPPLLPPDPAGRARVRALALSWAADSHPLIVPRVRQYLDAPLGVAEEARADWVRHWLAEGLGFGEDRLSRDRETGRFCHGDEPGLADICLAVQATGASHFGVEIDRYPTVAAIVARCADLPAFAEAAPLRQPGAPKQG